MLIEMLIIEFSSEVNDSYDILSFSLLINISLISDIQNWLKLKYE